MLCPKCQIVEMWRKKVENNQMFFVCKKCGEETVVDFEEENQDE